MKGVFFVAGYVAFCYCSWMYLEWNRTSGSRTHQHSWTVGRMKTLSWDHGMMQVFVVGIYANVDI